MNLTGVFVPLITPFDAEGDVALDALEALAERVLRDGASGLVALGTTGEPGSLTAAEQQAVVETVARVCQAREVTLVVGGNGGDARLSLVPPFVRPGEAGVLEYFRQLESPVPLVVYHVPYRTGQSLSAETLRKIAELPNVAGIKYAAGGIDDETMLFLSGELPDDFAVLGGDDPFIAPMLALGAHGGILASAHLETAKFVAMTDAWRTGDLTTGRRLGRELVGLSKALFAEPNPTVIKAVLHARGEIPTPGVRLPLLAAKMVEQMPVS
ncbi:dihydrodipicolinate synthase family protein [Kribbella italica]|uniref:4-hydroxy-tetrahydrodipicolinate synthase n=1 Tax=Kribbella italica TaxID=1540520 RepID=A0A7W9J537_9ACTN|nr:dihydrodipicolinate synthase family protein [Kribbella italica]MBB5835270.1 4-hydroxy-tetrahydrodipicolinate synthase [Kribbella italica]